MSSVILITTVRRAFGGLHCWLQTGREPHPVAVVEAPVGVQQVPSASIVIGGIAPRCHGDPSSMKTEAPRNRAERCPTVALAAVLWCVVQPGQPGRGSEAPEGMAKAHNAARDRGEGKGGASRLEACVVLYLIIVPS